MEIRNKAFYLFIPLVKLILFLQRKYQTIAKRLHKLKAAESLYELGSWQNSSRVHTIFGKLEGKIHKDTWNWRGIPYAQPPKGTLRWKAPLDPIPWIGTLKAKKFGPPSAQVLPFLGPVGTEDSLYLNIWRTMSDEKDLPVYLFIHGGGNSIGTSTMPDYFGHVVANDSNMILITLNYRLGVLGWFRHPSITSSGTDEDKSGNFATLDIIKALQWVKNNIIAFGGNPSNVTIAGESAGAMNVLSLLISPKAKGLFHRAVVESGLSITSSIEEAEAESDDLICRLLIKDKKAKNKNEAQKFLASMSDHEIDSYMRTKSPFTLIKNIPVRDMGMSIWPYNLTDGTVISKTGYEILKSDNWNKVPMIIGTNKDEMKLFGFFRNDPPRGTKLYDDLYKYASMIWKVSGSDSVVKRALQSPNPPKIFAYRFDWGTLDENGNSVLPGNLGHSLGAHHFSEIRFFLGTGVSELSILVGKTTSNENRLGRRKLNKLCLAYLANFAKTGDPNGQDLPEWPVITADKEQKKTIIIDAGFNDLKISYLDALQSNQDIIELIHKEQGKDSDTMMDQLEKSMFVKLE